MDALAGRAHPRVGARAVAVEWQCEQAGIQIVTVKQAGIAIEAGAVPSSLDSGPNGVPFRAKPIAVDPQSAGIVQGDQPVQRDPAEHLGVGVMKAAGTTLPNSLVRFTPAPADRLPDAGQHACRVPIDAPAAGNEAR